MACIKALVRGLDDVLQDLATQIATPSPHSLPFSFSHPVIFVTCRRAWLTPPVSCPHRPIFLRASSGLQNSRILACIPLELSTSAKDLADLAGVPVSQLTKGIRLLATRGFLQEQEPGSVVHTPLSAQFITGQSLLDASDFKAEPAVPAPLQMPVAMQLFGAAQGPAEAAMSAVRTFQSALQELSQAAPSVGRLPPPRSGPAPGGGGVGRVLKNELV